MWTATTQKKTSKSLTTLQKRPGNAKRLHGLYEVYTYANVRQWLNPQVASFHTAVTNGNDPKHAITQPKKATFTGYATDIALNKRRIAISISPVSRRRPVTSEHLT